MCHYTVITVPYINQKHADLLKIRGVIIWKVNILISKYKKQRACIMVIFSLLDNISYNIVFEHVCKLCKCLHGVMGNILKSTLAIF